MRVSLRDAGFTMIELIAVMAIITLLVGFILPAIFRARESGKRTHCISNLRQMGQALQIYYTDGNYRYPICDGIPSVPGAPQFFEVLEPYLKNQNIFHCPADRVYFKSEGSSYTWNTFLNNADVDSRTFIVLIPGVLPSNTPGVTDKESFHRKGFVNALFADYHAEEWEGSLK